MKKIITKHTSEKKLKICKEIAKSNNKKTDNPFLTSKNC